MIPSTLIISLSALHRISAELRRDVTFYAPLTDHLTYMGIEPGSFTRASSSTATWRDGAAHGVGVNVPRFEYSQGVPLGVLLDAASETLQFSSANLLSNGNSLFWVENLLVKHAPSEPSPFNSSGVWIRAGAAHIRDIVKFNRVLSAAEILAVAAALGAAVVESAGDSGDTLQLIAGGELRLISGGGIILEGP